MHAPARTLAIAVLLGAAGVGQTPNCTLIIHVTGFRDHRGDVGATLFTSPDGWPENNSKAYVHKPFPIPSDQATLTFDGLPPGRYAVAVMHDENSNHKLDRNIFGIPKEGFGFANNPRVTVSEPKWEEAAVNVVAPTTEITIRLIYK